MIKMHLPDRAAFNIQRLPDGDGRQARWTYIESFADKEVDARTVELVRARLDPEDVRVSVSKDGRTVTLKGTTDYRQIASMIVGEFIGWSPIADMNFRDLMGLAFIGMPSSAPGDFAELLGSPPPSLAAEVAAVMDEGQNGGPPPAPAPSSAARRSSRRRRPARK
jgi:hypothetical protein